MIITHRFNFKEFIKHLIIKTSDILVENTKDRSENVKIKSSI